MLLVTGTGTDLVYVVGAGLGKKNLVKPDFVQRTPDEVPRKRRGSAAIWEGWKRKHFLEKDYALHVVTKSEALLKWPSEDTSSRPIHLTMEKLWLREPGLGLGLRVSGRTRLVSSRCLLLHLNQVLVASSERVHGVCPS